jgi:hypothetical protein
MEQVSYAHGPNGTTVDGTASGKPYYGLYQIIYYPFSNDVYTPLIRHNGIYIGCYFHMGESVVGIPDPVDKAEQCVQDNIIESLTSRRTGGPVYTHVKYPLRYDGRQIFFGRPQADAALASSIPAELATLRSDADVADSADSAHSVSSAEGLHELQRRAGACLCLLMFFILRAFI